MRHIAVRTTCPGFRYDVTRRTYLVAGRRCCASTIHTLGGSLYIVPGNRHRRVSLGYATRHRGAHPNCTRARASVRINYADPDDWLLHTSYQKRYAWPEPD